MTLPGAAYSVWFLVAFFHQTWNQMSSRSLFFIFFYILLKQSLGGGYKGKKKKNSKLCYSLEDLLWNSVSGDRFLTLVHWRCKPSSLWFPIPRDWVFLPFWDRVSLCILVWPGTHNVVQADFELTDPPAIAFQLLEIKAVPYYLASFTLNMHILVNINYWVWIWVYGH